MGHEGYSQSRDKSLTFDVDFGINMARTVTALIICRQHVLRVQTLSRSTDTNACYDSSDILLIKELYYPTCRVKDTRWEV